MGFVRTSAMFDIFYIRGRTLCCRAVIHSRRRPNSLIRVAIASILTSLVYDVTWYDMSVNGEVYCVTGYWCSSTQQQAVGPFIPREFTALGFLERLDAYLTYQDYCFPSSSNSSSQWPPLSALRVVSSGRGQSCGDACSDQGRFVDLWHYTLNIIVISLSR